MTYIRPSDLKMRGYIKTVEEDEPTEIRIAGASIANEQRLESIESRLAALEEKLDKVDRKAWQGIWAQGKEVDELQERVDRHDEQWEQRYGHHVVERTE
jgi:tetrahydromethanopterin S-methyltransferase subunit G